MTKEEIDSQVQTHANTILNRVYRLTNPVIEVVEALLEMRKLDRVRMKQAQEARELAAKEKDSALGKIGL
jgi:hypothetical protein